MKSLTNKNCAWWWLRPPFTGCSSTFWQAQAFVATYSTIYDEETLAHGSKTPVLYCQLQPSWVNFYSSKRLRSQICCILSSNKLWSLAKLQEWWLWSMIDKFFCRYVLFNVPWCGYGVFLLHVTISVPTDREQHHIACLASVLP